MHKKIFIILIIYVVDYLSKMYIIKNFQLYECKKIFTIVNFFYVRNSGIIFNIIDNYYTNHYKIFLMFNIIIIIFIIKETIYSNNISYPMILSGALGNLVNKIYYGYVIDFIDINVNHIHYIIFNVADISIIIGIIILLYNL